MIVMTMMTAAMIQAAAIHSPPNTIQRTFNNKLSGCIVLSPSPRQYMQQMVILPARSSSETPV